MPTSEVERLVKRRALQDFDAGVDDFKRLLNVNAMDTGAPERLRRQKSAKHVGIERALQVVPIAKALDEIGFWQQNPKCAGVWLWAAIHGGAELVITAGTNWIGQWQLTARCNTLKQALWDEAIMPDQAPRGAIVLAIAEFWRSAFGRADSLPGAFDVGLQYERHKATMRAIDLNLPHVDLDGQVLRAIRKWMMQQNGTLESGVGPFPDAPLTLSVDNGLMQMEVNGITYGCSIRSGWIDACQVSLREFLKLPPWALRGHTIRLTASIHEVRLGSWAIPSSQRFQPPA